MHKLVSEAITQARDTAAPAALAEQVTRYRSAALIGASQTAGRAGALMRKHYALARRLLDRQDDRRRERTREAATQAQGRRRQPHRADPP